MIRVDAQPTPDGELRRQILSKCVEKSEREWWAARTIEKLEFELNAANAEIEEKRKDVVWLATEKAKLENYVMLLEEAGDTMANAYRQICYDAYDDQQVDNWFKAKESKP